MKNRNFFLILSFVVVGIIVLGYLIIGYFKNVNFGENVALLPTSTATFSGGEFVGENNDEDGEHRAYITKIYEKDGKDYIDVDYFQTLEGSDAVRRAIKEEKWNCSPPSGVSEEDFIKLYPKIYSEGAGDIRRIYSESCEFPNGMWMDVNDNAKIRTFEVDLKEPIIVAYNRDEFGEHEEYNIGMAWTISWDTLKNVFFKSGYGVPFLVTIAGDKVVKIQEIYRP